MQQARMYVTPDQAGESAGPRGFPKLREPGQNSDYQFYDPAFHMRQQQIGYVKNRLRNQGFYKIPEDEGGQERQ